MNRLREKLQDFMQGRNGLDSLARVCLYGALIIILISAFLTRVSAAASSILDALGLTILIYGYFRVLSRNIAKRYVENERFLNLFSGFSGSMNRSRRAAQDKTHRYYRCPQCGQTVRVPRGKGRIEIRCPKCRNSFIKKT